MIMRFPKFRTADLLVALSIGALGFLLAVPAYLRTTVMSAKEELEKQRGASK